MSWHGTLNTPGSKKLYESLMKNFQTYNEWRPSYRHYIGYITHVQLFEAIKRAGTIDTVSVIKALEGHKFDGLKWTQSQWRAFDHQNVQDVIMSIAKRDSNWKSEDDYFEIIDHFPGDFCAPSYEEWKAMGGRDLEPYDSLKK